tara:strand:- start:27 stop:491 length:465 start_codon:yes stop_codon:yes gene_type:complete
MNLAQDLLRKSTGYIHAMPVSVNQPVRAYASKNKRNLNERTQYVNESGQSCYRGDIADKYGVSPSKVKDLFDKYSPDEVYRLIGTDLRSKNGKDKGKDKVYALPCGKWATSQIVANYYFVSRSVIQRAWVVHGKDPTKANEYLMKRFFGDHSKV